MNLNVSSRKPACWKVSRDSKKQNPTQNQFSIHRPRRDCSVRASSSIVSPARTGARLNSLLIGFNTPMDGWARATASISSSHPAVTKMSLLSRQSHGAAVRPKPSFMPFAKPSFDVRRTTTTSTASVPRTCRKNSRAWGSVLALSTMNRRLGTVVCRRSRCTQGTNRSGRFHVRRTRSQVGTVMKVIVDCGRTSPSRRRRGGSAATTASDAPSVRSARQWSGNVFSAARASSMSPPTTRTAR